MNKHRYLPVRWPEAWHDKLNHVKAVTTLKDSSADSGNLTNTDYQAFNMATHVGDDLQSVLDNREQLFDDLQLPSPPVWLEQVHSNKVISADVSCGEVEKADASFTGSRAVVCAVLTADCLPVFFSNQTGSEVAVAHAGWRGLHAGIISNTVRAMRTPAEELLVSLGPAIGPQAFEVGEDVFHAFVGNDRSNEAAFVATSNNHYLCDIYQLARTELRSMGVEQVSGGEYCTYQDKQQFYSFRRQNNTGRMASLIWID